MVGHQDSLALFKAEMKVAETEGIPYSNNISGLLQKHPSVAPIINQQLTKKLPSKIRPSSNELSLSAFETYPQWCIWKKIDGKKLPLNPATLKPAKSSDPSTWRRHDRAKFASPSKDGGIGLMLGPVQGVPDLWLGGIDLDTCRNSATGVIETWATEIINRVDSYCEISPSGTGVKIFFLHDGSQVDSFTFKNKGEKHPPAIEGYFKGRYFTVTGQEVLGSDNPVDGKRPLRRLKSEARQWLVDVAGPRLKADTPVAQIGVTGRSEALIAFACDYVHDSKSKEDFEAAIHEGDECPDGSAHVADQNDPQRAIDRAWAEALTRNPPIEFDDLSGLVDLETRKPTLSFYGPSEIGKIAEAHDFIEGILYERKVSVVYGAPASGKTFAVFDLAAHVTLGRAWQGCAVDQSNVLYIALEGASGMRRRRDAWSKRNGVDDPNSLPIHFADGSLDIRNGKATRKQIIEYVKANRIGWVIVDTLSRAMAGGEESGAADMGAAFLGADEISRLSGAHVTLVHHSGKDETKGGRGSSLLLGNIDTELHITRNGDSRNIRLSKQKEGEDGLQWGFKLETVELNYKNKRGKPVTSCVAVFGEMIEFTPEDGLNERQRVALEILKVKAAESGNVDKDSYPLLPDRVFLDALNVHNWLDSGAARNARSNDFRRLCTHLADNGNILITNGLITVYT